MRIDDALAAFFTSPVTIIVGTRGDSCRPEIGRAVGVRVDEGSGVIELVVSAWQWPGTVANLRTNGRAAVTFARPSDYVSYQVKGRATLRGASPEDVVLSERYMADVLRVLVGLGLEQRLAAPWLTNRDAVVARVELDEIYVQTPGAKAGQQLETRP